MATNTAKVRVFKKQTLVRDSWVSLMKLYWLLLLNGVATVIIIYALTLIIHH